MGRGRCGVHGGGARGIPQQLAEKPQAKLGGAADAVADPTCHAEAMLDHPLVYAALSGHRKLAEDDTRFFVIHWDVVAIVACCVLLLWWWVDNQNSHRCHDCGYAPIWCRCPSAEKHRH